MKKVILAALAFLGAVTAHAGTVDIGALTGKYQVKCTTDDDGFITNLEVNYDANSVEYSFNGRPKMPGVKAISVTGADAIAADSLDGYSQFLSEAGIDTKDVAVLHIVQLAKGVDSSYSLIRIKTKENKEINLVQLGWQALICQ